MKYYLSARKQLRVVYEEFQNTPPDHLSVYIIVPGKTHLKLIKFRKPTISMIEFESISIFNISIKRKSVNEKNIHD